MPVMAEEEYPDWAGEGMCGGYPGKVELTMSRPKNTHQSTLIPSLF